MMPVACFRGGVAGFGAGTTGCLLRGCVRGRWAIPGVWPWRRVALWVLAMIPASM